MGNKGHIVITPHLTPFRPRRQGETAKHMLTRIEKRLSLIQFELSNWITVPTTYGIQITQELEDEKVLFQKVRVLVLEEMGELIKEK